MSDRKCNSITHTGEVYHRLVPLGSRNCPLLPSLRARMEWCLHPNTDYHKLLLTSTVNVCEAVSLHDETIAITSYELKILFDSLRQTSENFNTRPLGISTLVSCLIQEPLCVRPDSKTTMRLSGQTGKSNLSRASLTTLLRYSSPYGTTYYTIALPNFPWSQMVLCAFLRGRISWRNSRIISQEHGRHVGLARASRTPWEGAQSI